MTPQLEKKVEFFFANPLFKDGYNKEERERAHITVDIHLSQEIKVKVCLIKI